MSLPPVSSVTSAPPPAQFNAAQLRRAAPEAQRAAVAQQFEAVLVRQMLGKTMTSMLGGAASGAAGNVYGDMLTDTLAQQLTAGRGLGLGQFIQQQLTPRGAAAAETGAPGGALLERDTH
jgi:Rod binding domain-containing protein